MAQPSDLVAHYSSLIFQTRIYALTFVGVVLGASIEWIQSARQSNFIGFLLVLVVGSLAEANRRYTHSYLCACLASSRNESGSNDARFWNLFRHVNESPWSGTEKKGKLIARFMLYWSTYIPGVITGEYLIFRSGQPTFIGWLGTLIAICLVCWWMYSSIKPPNIKNQMDKFILLLDAKKRH